MHGLAGVGIWMGDLGAAGLGFVRGAGGLGSVRFGSVRSAGWTGMGWDGMVLGGGLACCHFTAAILCFLTAFTLHGAGTSLGGLGESSNRKPVIQLFVRWL